MQHKAKKLVIITEKLIAHKVTAIIEACGASGYTITSADGKGSRGVRTDHGAASEAYANVKIEVIVSSDSVADDIAEQVAAKYFSNYSGITYAVDVEILRPQKFQEH